MTCIGTPVSWLVLERFELGELPDERVRMVEEHLAGCEACRACRAQIAGDERVVPELPEMVVARARRARAPRVMFAAGVIAAAAAIVLVWMVRRPGDGEELAGVKGGGELVLSLVRERGGDVAHSPATYRDGDRFKVLVTCGDAAPLELDVTVEQAGATFRPLAAARVRCGNRVPIDGAFRLTGTGPVRVCAATDRRRACAILTPEP